MNKFTAWKAGVFDGVAFKFGRQSQYSQLFYDPLWSQSYKEGFTSMYVDDAVVDYWEIMYRSLETAIQLDED